MDVSGTIGVGLGASGLTFAIIAWGQIAELRKEFEALKKSLEDSGVIEEQPESEDV